ncbi:hypothetical protein [Glutamicibacter arilaitensis]|uniref:hypothetical protein n=1 Tax=Glutamicibacter arilaitensis TaxID=256701 RepID=UPI0038504188
MTTQYEYRPGPSHVRERRAHSDVAEHLEENPGVWVKVTTTGTQNAAANMAWQIKKGVRAAFRPAGHFDAYSTGNEVVARYIGAK